LAQNWKFNASLLTERNIVIFDGCITETLDAHKREEDSIQGVLINVTPTNKSFCICGKPFCKGAAIGNGHNMVMN
jgi:hypothetical protein